MSREQEEDLVVSESGGMKRSKFKLPLHLIPASFLYAVACILKFGTEKYDERNWEKGMSWSDMQRAAVGHLSDWANGERKDPETGKSHLWHAACCVMFLVVWEQRSVGDDDLPTSHESGNSNHEMYKI